MQANHLSAVRQESCQADEHKHAGLDNPAALPAMFTAGFHMQRFTALSLVYAGKEAKPWHADCVNSGC